MVYIVELIKHQSEEGMQKRTVLTVYSLFGPFFHPYLHLFVCFLKRLSHFFLLLLYKTLLYADNSVLILGMRY